MFRKGDELIPGYRLEKFLGRGQFGEVWKTTAPGRTSAALKFIDLSGKQGHKEFRAVQRMKEIRHAHLMPIIALWLLDQEGKPLDDQILDSYSGSNDSRSTLQPSSHEQPAWLVLGMLLGRGSLQDRLEECQKEGLPGIPLPELLRYMEEAAKGIDFLNTRQHDVGEGRASIQHCDIKPANIMLVGDSVVVCDFGLARVLTDNQATATGMVGSPAYMAPECIERKPGAASDQYSLAVSYVELRTGRLPFRDESYVAVLDAHRSGTLDLSGLTEPEQRVIRHATAIRPEDRYATTQEMVQALRVATLGSGGGAAGASTGGTLRKFVYFLGVAAAVMVLSAVAYRFRPDGWGHGPEQTSPNVERHLLRFEPPQSQVWINGDRVALSDQGEYEVELAVGKKVDIEVRASEDFDPVRGEFSAEQLREQSYRIALEPSVDFLTKRASALASADQHAESVVAFTQALQRNPEAVRPAPAHRLRAHGMSIETLDSAPDGTAFLAGSNDKKASLWRFPLADAPEPKYLVGHQKFIDFVAFGSDSRWLVTGSWDAIQLWSGPAMLSDESSGKPVALAGHDGDVSVFELSGDRRQLATGGSDQIIRLWDLASAEPQAAPRLLRGHTEPISHLAFSPDGTSLLSAAFDSKLIRWNLAGAPPRPTPWPTMAAEREPTAITGLSGNGPQWVLAYADGNLEFRDADGQVIADKQSHSDTIHGLQCDPAHRWLASWGDQGVANLFDLKEANFWNTPLTLTRHTEAIVAGAFSPPGDLLATGGADEMICVWNLNSQPPATRPFRLVVAGRISSLVVTADDRWLIAGLADGTLLIWDLRVVRAVLEAFGGVSEIAPPKFET